MDDERLAAAVEYKQAARAVVAAEQRLFKAWEALAELDMDVSDVAGV